MKFKLTSMQSAVSVDSPSTAKTHTLHFSEVLPEESGQVPASPMIAGGPSSLTLRLTAEEAAEYTLGFVYDLALGVE